MIHQWRLNHHQLAIIAHYKPLSTINIRPELNHHSPWSMTIKHWEPSTTIINHSRPPLSINHGKTWIDNNGWSLWTNAINHYNPSLELLVLMTTPVTTTSIYQSQSLSTVITTISSNNHHQPLTTTVNNPIPWRFASARRVPPLRRRREPRRWPWRERRHEA